MSQAAVEYLAVITRGVVLSFSEPEAAALSVHGPAELSGGNAGPFGFAQGRLSAPPAKRRLRSG